MQNKVNLIMPMGGRGSRFFYGGYAMPKPLIEISGKPFFYWATQAINKYVELQTLTFVVLQEHIDGYAIDQKIKAFFPQARLVIIPKVLNGAVLTSLEGAKSIDNDLPIIFNDCDQTFHCSELYNFCANGDFSSIDGALVSFKSTEEKYSFLLHDTHGNVTKTVEKQAISENAICGAYYFKNKAVFEAGVTDYLGNCSYSEYFMSGVYNSMIEQGKKIRYFDVDWHLPFGIPEEYNSAKDSRLFEVVI